MIGLLELKQFISPEGKKLFIEFIEKAHRERGSGWIDYLKAEYPMFAWIFDLTINRTADEAVAELEEEYGFAVTLFQHKIKNFHGEIRAEINKRRF